MKFADPCVLRYTGGEILRRITESSTNYNVIKNKTCRDLLSLGEYKYNDITFTDVPFITKENRILTS